MNGGFNMIYYEANSIISNFFFMVPKLLFTERFSNVSSNAKIMFIYMLDRCKLSIKNNWVDETNHVYILYPVDQLAESMNLKKSQIFSLLKELEHFSLIKRRREGKGSPNKIYVANIDAQVEAERKMEQVSKSEYEKEEGRIYDETLSVHQNSCENKLGEKVIEPETKEEVPTKPEVSIDQEEEASGGMPEHLKKKLYENLGLVCEKFDLDSNTRTSVGNQEAMMDIQALMSRRAGSDIQKTGCHNEIRNLEWNSDVRNTGCHSYMRNTEEFCDVQNVGYQKYNGNIGAESTNKGALKTPSNTTKTAENGEKLNLKTSCKKADKSSYFQHKRGGSRVMSRKLNPSNNKNNNINNNIINACARAREISNHLYEKTLEAIKHQINYGALVTKNPERVDAINTIVSVMTTVAVEACVNPSMNVKVANEYIPYKDINAKYSKLLFRDINQVLQASTGTVISNMENYFLVCLYRYQASYNTYQTQNRYRGVNGYHNFQQRDLSSTIDALERYGLGI